MDVKSAKNWWKSRIIKIVYGGETFGEWRVETRNLKEGYEYVPYLEIRKTGTKEKIKIRAFTKN